MSKYLIIRHCQSKNNNGETGDLNSGLSDEGVRQAKRLELHLQLGLDMAIPFYLSPFLRCLQTASIIGCPEFNIVDCLCESPDHYPDGVVIGDKIFKVTEQEYLKNLSEFIKTIPEQAVFITHGTTCVILSKLIMGEEVTKIPEWDNDIQNGDIFLIKNGELKLIKCP